MTGNFGGGAPDGAGADDSIESLLGAYALDAVSGDERLQVDMLLERSPSARAELATMQVAVDALAAEAASAPPIGTWDRLRDRLAETGAESGTGSAPSVGALFPDGALSIPPGVRSSDRRTDEASDGGRDQASADADADGALDAAGRDGRRQA